MQIISGRFKHKQLKSPKSDETHPMGNRERLALFNILNGKIEGKKVLDAFAGTGALGLEALSRGAKNVVFIEKSPSVAKILKENIKNTLGPEENLSKLVIKSLENYKTDEKFELIFADPPYTTFNETLLDPLEDLLEKDAVLALSTPKTAKTPEFESLEPISRKEYAGSAIILYRKIK